MFEEKRSEHKDYYEPSPISQQSFNNVTTPATSILSNSRADTCHNPQKSIISNRTNEKPFFNETRNCHVSNKNSQKKRNLSNSY